MKYKLYLLIFFIAFKVQGQQDPQSSMYLVDKMLINPAFAGSSNWAVGTLKYRQNVTGFSNNFSTQTFNYHSPIQSKHLGVGVKIVNDNRVAINNLNIGCDVSYHLNLAGGKLSLGFEGGIYRRSIKYDDLIILNWNDPLFIGNTSSIIPDFSFGTFYQKRQLYIGISRMHISKMQIDSKINAKTQSFIFPHHYLVVGNIFDLNRNLAIEPSILIKQTQKKLFQIDLNAILCYEEKVSAGVQYRIGDAFMFLVKYNISENLRVSYSYDLPMGKFSGNSKGAHELVISYGVKLPPPPVKKEIHPRYYF